MTGGRDFREVGGGGAEYRLAYCVLAKTLWQTPTFVLQRRIHVPRKGCETKWVRVTVTASLQHCTTHMIVVSFQRQTTFSLIPNTTVI
jgi:hypothetical protein